MASLCAEIALSIRHIAFCEKMALWLIFFNLPFATVAKYMSKTRFWRLGINNQSCNRHDPVHVSESSKQTELTMHEVTLNQPIRAI